MTIITKALRERFRTEAVAPRALRRQLRFPAGQMRDSVSKFDPDRGVVACMRQSADRLIDTCP